MNKDIFVIIEHLGGEVADISYVMLAAAREIATALQGEVVGILLGEGIENLGQNLAADMVWLFDDPRLADYSPTTYLHILGELIQQHAPRTVIFGDTSTGAEVGAGLSARLDLPMVSACHRVTVGDQSLGYESRICGGRIQVQGELPSPTALIAMVPGGYNPDSGRSAAPPPSEMLAVPRLEEPPIHVLSYIQPETGDVDISRAEVLVAVGRGIQNQDNLEIVEELAEALGGDVCASRPVVDQGWLPVSRLVGKSGRRVRPKIYLALGISGAPEHVEAIGDSQVIVAVNTDPEAPIFNLAQFGTTSDLFDLVPVLTDHIRQARSERVA